ncbi:hypothetical protein D3C76_1023000 [compost metagenome]
MKRTVVMAVRGVATDQGGRALPGGEVVVIKRLGMVVAVLARLAQVYLVEHGSEYRDLALLQHGNASLHLADRRAVGLDHIDHRVRMLGQQQRVADHLRRGGVDNDVAVT